MIPLTLLQKRAILSAVAAVAVHVFVLGFWVLLIILDLPLWAVASAENEPVVPEPEVMVVMRPFISDPAPPPAIAQAMPELSQPEPVPKQDEPKPPAVEEAPALPIQEPRETMPMQDRRFARTSPDQEGKPDAPTEILGERDTRAASELEPTPEAAANTLSQDGAAPLFPGHVETVDRTYEDGSVGMDATGEETETPQDTSAARKNDSLMDDQTQVESTKPDASASARPRNQHLKEGRLLPHTDVGDGKGVIEDKPDAETLPKPKPNQGASESDAQGEEIEQTPPKQGGFEGFSRKIKVTGSISRSGKSALNVKNSPLGRYQALVSKAVELQWRRNCEQHRDHIVPGVISLRFYVDQHGGISGIKFQEVVGGNYIEQGFTQRAIRQAKLPKMSKSVLKELKGDPLELMYNFYF
ncbi:MAG: hypothetical protein KJO21_05385 [Verrucomicrobiae bacterium]|nr:hypothetical protein [Verrucomicrobiae bacterium]NNJ43154.1 hypothetical protein [Akkermansiaceae bacterium]